ncbi:MAG TPA: hypothetical protein V6C91_18545, partial [Coleofasciculaceae cyanobacterium]
MELLYNLFRGLATATVCFPTDSNEVRLLLASRGVDVLSFISEEPLLSIVSKHFLKHQRYG